MNTLFDKYLYDQLIEEFGKRTLAEIQIPPSIKENLNQRFELRPYQVDAFQRFICYYSNSFDFKKTPSHLLFNMATGSGKTLIMGGIILYLYEKGYRNFLFFVSSTNIIEKTKDNFLNTASIKYLFNKIITIGNRRVKLMPVENFETLNPDGINICFTTIQKLHSDLTSEKENSITFEDFKKHRVVLIADEAHHMNVKTKSQGELLESWENTVENVFSQNQDNLLLEFTATHDYASPSMINKYRDKVITRYDLLQFRNDKYSKDVVIVQSDFELEDRIIQALILSQYKQEVAAKYRINLKSVILFKAQRTIEQSRVNKENFHKIVDELDGKKIRRIRKSDIPMIENAFLFFADNNISDEQLAERLTNGFHRDFCLSVNDETEQENYQILINTLEDRNNRIRAIFAVQKLNEGWDVLNLYDIVRCYESRDTGRAKIGSTTMSEAQLIGRGARYFPFTIDGKEDKYRRKFDLDIDNELRVLEELHYHSINDSRYISEITQALIQEGMMDNKIIDRQLQLKDSFKDTDFYKYGVVWFNEKRPKDFQSIRSLSDLGVKRKNFIHNIATGHGEASAVLNWWKGSQSISEVVGKDIKVSDIEMNIIQSAISRNPFYRFSSLNKYFPHLTSIQDFITSKDFLAGLEITFEGDHSFFNENKSEKLSAMIGLLHQIETEIKSQITEFEGSKNFTKDRVRNIFTDKIMRFDEKNERGNFDSEFEQFVAKKDWFAFKTIFGTSEEKSFVRMLSRQIDRLKEKYERIYLLRNEGHFAIYNFADGQPFQPDFVLFLREKDGEIITFQLFIEPKGKFLQEKDKWKEVFLAQIKEQFEGKSISFEDKKYRMIGVPFYNNEDENIFKESLWKTIG